MVASDRISVFDVVLPDEIPDKGRVLTALSSFWFDHTADIVGNHVISCDPTDFPPMSGDVAGRATLVRATRPIRLECVVRGYVFGHGWQEYQAQRHGRRLRGARGPAPGRHAARPLFTPTTKAESGHDVPLTADEAVGLVGARRVRAGAGHLPAPLRRGARHAESRGVILADTKFEFGEHRRRHHRHRRDDDARLVALLAEGHVSSRGRRRRRSTSSTCATSWTATGWDHDPPAPRMPAEVIANTRAKYIEAYESDLGVSPFDDWYGPDDD